MRTGCLLTLICLNILDADFLVVGMKHGTGMGMGTGNMNGEIVLYMGRGKGT